MGDTPFSNVVVLRLIVAPLWFGFLPLLLAADANWAKLDATLAADLKKQLEAQGNAKTDSWCSRSFRLIRASVNAHWHIAPVMLWLELSFAMIGTSIGVYTTQRTAGAVLGAVIGSVAGYALTTTEALKQHWYEFCYWSHMLVAYTTVTIALIARFDVFWPCLVCWGLLGVDRCVLMRLSLRTMYIQAGDSRVVRRARPCAAAYSLRRVPHAACHTPRATRRVPHTARRTPRATRRDARR